MVPPILSREIRTRARIGRPWAAQDFRAGSRASVLVVVLWITAGLTALVLYFAASMGLELRASANRAADVAAGQAIESAADKSKPR